MSDGDDDRPRRVTTAELREALKSVRETLRTVRAQLTALSTDSHATSEAVSVVRSELAALAEDVEKLVAWAHTGNGRESASTRITLLERDLGSIKKDLAEDAVQRQKFEAAQARGRWTVAAATISALAAVGAAAIAALSKAP